jgi:hypothetical protein
LTWKPASPTASASSTMKMSGLRCEAIAKPSRSSIPDEYIFTGRSSTSASSAKSTIASKRSRISARDMPRMRP